MKYIKSFERFDIKKEMPPIEVRTDMTNFNNAEANTKDYNARKNILLNIYKTYAEDENPSPNAVPRDLYNKLLAGKFIQPGNKSTVIFINPLFAEYSEFCRKQRETTNIDNTLKQKADDLDNIKKNVSNNIGDRETANKDIETLNKDISTQKQTLDQTTKDINDLQKDSKNKLKNTVKDLEISRKRITRLDNNH